MATTLSIEGTTTTTAAMRPRDLAPLKAVINADAARGIGMPTLEALNRGQISGLSGISSATATTATTATTDNSRHIGQLVVQSNESPRAWLDETLWRVAG